MRLILLICILYGIYVYVQKHEDLLPSSLRAPTSSQESQPVADSTPEQPANTSQKIMVEVYTLTHCPACMALERNLTRAKIQYVKYDIQLNPERKKELDSRLRSTGTAGGRIGMPVTFLGSQKVYMGAVPASELQRWIY